MTIPKSLPIVQRKGAVQEGSKDTDAGRPQRQKGISQENIAYIIVCIFFAISFLSSGLTRYAIYASPAVLLLLWVIFRAKAPTGNQIRAVAPFLFLIALFVVYSPITGIAAWKWTFFVTVYTTIFLLFDFSKTRLNLLYLNLLLILFFGLSIARIGALDINVASLEQGLIYSTVTTESTFAFPLGLFSCYWLIRRRYILAACNIVLTVLAFKRVVFMAFFVFLATLLVPRKIRRNWVFAAVLGLATTASGVIAIEFATGQFDKEIRELTGQSASQLSQGRQGLWHETLKNVDFSYAHFMWLGVGIDSILRAGRPNYPNWVPFHNDILVVYLSYGFVALVIFVSLILIRSSPEIRSMNAFLVCLFFSDNVLIYEHVMIIYLFITAQLTIEDE